MSGHRIVLDPGHGGTDPGAMGASGRPEKQYNLQVALLARDALQRLGYSVILTREADTTVALEDRVPIAVQAHAQAFVSIHHNSSSTSTSNGTEVLYNPNDPASAALARSIYDQVIARTGLRPRGLVARGDLWVLRAAHRAGLPAALIEVGFINNPDEEALLARPDMQVRVAQAIAEGVARFFAPRRP